MKIYVRQLFKIILCLQVAVIALTTLVAITLAEHDATSYAYYHPKFENTHHDGHDHYVRIFHFDIQTEIVF